MVNPNFYFASKRTRIFSCYFKSRPTNNSSALHVFLSLFTFSNLSNLVLILFKFYFLPPFQFFSLLQNYPKPEFLKMPLCIYFWKQVKFGQILVTESWKYHELQKCIFICCLAALQGLYRGDSHSHPILITVYKHPNFDPMVTRNLTTNFGNQVGWAPSKIWICDLLIFMDALTLSSIMLKNG